MEYLKIIGAILGIAAFIWKVWDLFQSYLHIALTVKTDDGRPVARTTVENKSLKPKRIDNAILLIGPESETPIDTYNNIANSAGDIKPVKHTNQIVQRTVSNKICGGKGHLIIPLPFYYSENVRISDEVVSYSAPLEKDDFELGVTYSVRFFISGKYRLHRSTHDCFTIHDGNQ